MITIIDTKTGKSFNTECYTTAGEKVGITAATLSRWERTKKEHRHEPIEWINQFIIYFGTETLKAKKGYAIQAADDIFDSCQS